MLPTFKTLENWIYNRVLLKFLKLSFTRLILSGKFFLSLVSNTATCISSFLKRSQIAKIHVGFKCQFKNVKTYSKIAISFISVREIYLEIWQPCFASANENLKIQLDKQRFSSNKKSQPLLRGIKSVEQW